MLEAEYRIVLDAAGGCDYYDERWHFRALQEGCDRHEVMRGQLGDVRLYAFEALTQGDRLEQRREGDELIWLARFPAVRPGHRRHVVTRIFPPADEAPITLVCPQRLKLSTLRFVVEYPPSLASTLEVVRIERLESDLDFIPMQRCSPVFIPPASNAVAVSFHTLEPTFGYGVQWFP